MKYSSSDKAKSNSGPQNTLIKEKAWIKILPPMVCWCEAVKQQCPDPTLEITLPRLELGRTKYGNCSLFIFDFNPFN